jgi:hypothetical protein
MVYIYILQLEQNKYYIGKTDNPDYRLNNHFNSNGSEWTKLYKPIKVLQIIPDCDDYDEDKYTQIYMDKYGFDNVRGGSFVQIKLDKTITNILQQKHNGTNNKCFKCGVDGHFANECANNNKKIDDKNNEKLCNCATSINFISNELNNLNINEELNNVYICENCDKEFTDEKKCKNHEKKCNKIICYRCGRDGHKSTSCYASKDINGRFLK